MGDQHGFFSLGDMANAELFGTEMCVPLRDQQKKDLPQAFWGPIILKSSHMTRIQVPKKTF